MNTPNSEAHPDPGARHAALLDWLLKEGRRAPAVAALTGELADRLTAEGLPLWRLFFSLPVLHPLVRVLTVVWRDDRSEVEAVRRAHGTELEPGYLNSPIAAIVDHGADALRFRLEKIEPPYPHPVLDDLQAEGCTDYVAMALRFGGDRSGVVSLSTRRPGGFSTDDLALIDGVRPALVAALETMILKKLATTVLETYVGRRTGERVLSGEIRRGSLEITPAVLWYCDLRGFTPLSDRLPPAELIALLNGYFEIMGGAVEDHGGEILKFIGDALLAVFPLADGRDDAPDERDAAALAACTAALAAARRAVRDIDARNAERLAWGEPALHCGIALHLGEALYGNIGAPTRLDFTVIGPAVNLTNRIEGLCKRLDRTVLASGDFARALPVEWEPLGAHDVKGLVRPVEVFGLPEESPAARARATEARNAEARNAERRAAAPAI